MKESRAIGGASDTDAGEVARPSGVIGQAGAGRHLSPRPSNGGAEADE